MIQKMAHYIAEKDTMQKNIRDHRIRIGKFATNYQTAGNILVCIVWL